MGMGEVPSPPERVDRAGVGGPGRGHDGHREDPRAPVAVQGSGQRPQVHPPIRIHRDRADRRSPDPQHAGGALHRVVCLGGRVDGQTSTVESEVRRVVPRLLEGVLAGGPEGHEVRGGPAAGVDAAHVRGQPADRAEPFQRELLHLVVGRQRLPLRGHRHCPRSHDGGDCGRTARDPAPRPRRGQPLPVGHDEAHVLLDRGIGTDPVLGSRPGQGRLPVDRRRQRIRHVGGEPVVDRLAHVPRCSANRPPQGAAATCSARYMSSSRGWLRLAQAASPGSSALPTAARIRSP